MATKKIGRPTDAKKDFMLRTRIDEDTLKKLDDVATKKQKSRSEVVRDGVILQYDIINK